MKKCLLLFAIFYWNSTFAQLDESFNDGNFTASPVWSGDVTAFKINSSKKLQSLKSDTAGVRYLSTASTLASETKWEFSVNLTFAATSSNYVRVYLLSDQPNLKSSLNGYFVHIGENGSLDSYDLYKQTGMITEKVINGIEGRAAAATLNTRIKVTLTKEGKWQLWTRNTGENDYTLEGSTNTSNAVLTTTSFGLYCAFTKSYADKFFFDDFLIKPLEKGDTDPPAEDPADTVSTPGDGTDIPLSETIAKNEILVNEILFNPREGGVDFLEIYNNSDKALNLKYLSVATIKKDTLSSIKVITKADKAFLPNRYLALSTDPGIIKTEYPAGEAGAFLQVAALPAFNNDQGIVVLICDSVVIDQLNYTESMHSPLLKNFEGVSLERRSFSKETNETGNFTSAAASEGFATPGYKNSMNTEETAPSDAVELESKSFSPDSDGFEDELIIRYSLKKPGAIANISAFSSAGVRVKQIARNLTLGSEGTISWDGLNDKGSLAPVGIYIIHFMLTDLDGRTRSFKKTCVLAAKF